MEICKIVNELPRRGCYLGEIVGGVGSVVVVCPDSLLPNELAIALETKHTSVDGLKVVFVPTSA